MVHEIQHLPFLQDNIIMSQLAFLSTQVQETGTKLVEKEHFKLSLQDTKTGNIPLQSFPIYNHA